MNKNKLKESIINYNVYSVAIVTVLLSIYILSGIFNYPNIHNLISTTVNTVFVNDKVVIYIMIVFTLIVNYILYRIIIKED